MRDLISRQAAIDEVCKMMRECFGADEEKLDAIEVTLHELPAVQPERKRGEWIKILNAFDTTCECSVCHARDYVSNTDRYWFNRNFCPFCGADMKEV